MYKSPLLCTVILLALHCHLSANLLLNPGFESGNTNNWSPLGSCTISSDAGVAHSGNYSCLVENRSQNWNGPIQSIKNVVQQGVFYEFSAWVKAKEPLPIPLNQVGYYRIALKIIPVNGSNQYPEVGVVKVYKTGWIKIRGYYRFDLPMSEYTDILIDIQGPDSAVDFYVDDVSIDVPVPYSPPSSTTSDFVRANGRDLVIGAGNTPLKLQGINFWAYSDDLADDPMDFVFNSYRYDWTDYSTAAGMGFNCIRLNMDFRAFEDDAAPFTYKQEGWQWLEKNIVYAKNNGLFLLLDMHTPQGGYQSYGFSGDFWGSGGAAIANRNRLTALWVEIATRYKDEPTIAGYDLINEPLPPTATDYYTYIQSLVNAIRAIDSNHLIDIEQAFSPAGGDYPHQLVAGGNIMYDTHYYYRWSYTSQLIPAYGGLDGGSYPDAGTGFDKSDLELTLLDGGLQFCIDHNVPHNAGEFGLSQYIFPIPAKGAIKWMTDIYDLHNSNKTNAQQWTWHSSSWGLYTNTFGFPDEGYKTSELANFLQNNNVPSFPLPVQYTHTLEAFAQNKQIVLQWTTATEVQNHSFIVEHSTDGKEWLKISTIAAKGSYTHYKVLDENPVNGLNFYRLCQIDLDENFNYSNIATAYYEQGEKMICISPNPVLSTSQISFPQDGKDNYQYALYLTDGTLIKTGFIGRMNHFEFRKGNLTPGVYFLKIFNTEKSVGIQKMVVN